MAGVLLPFYTEAELVNSTAGMKFVAEAIADVAKGGCVLCYENECQNGGRCGQPNEVFDCACPEGFQVGLAKFGTAQCISTLSRSMTPNELPKSVRKHVHCP